MDRNEINLEILRIAKQLVINDYVDKRAELHNQWVTQSDLLWKTRGVKLGYPTIPPYPNEDDICAAANKLLKFLETPHYGNEVVEIAKEDCRISVDENLSLQDDVITTEEVTLVDDSSQTVEEDKETSLLGRLRRGWK